MLNNKNHNYKDQTGKKLMVLPFVVVFLFLMTTMVLIRPSRTFAAASISASPVLYVADDAQDANLSDTLQHGSPKNDCKTVDEANCGIVKWIVTAINIFSAIVMLVIVAMIIIGGIQYSTSRDEPQSVAAAKQKILNAVIALVVFIFGFAFLQWVVPGGIF